MELYAICHFIKGFHQLGFGTSFGFLSQCLRLLPKENMVTWNAVFELHVQVNC